MLFRRTIIIKKICGGKKQCRIPNLHKSVATSWAAEGEFLSPPQFDRAIKMNIMLRHYFERLGALVDRLIDRQLDIDQACTCAHFH